MNAITNLSLSRRALLQSTGALVVSFAIPDAVAQVAGSAIPADKPALHPTELDSWVAVDAKGIVTAFFGKMDMGQGVDIAIAQIVADELDVAVASIHVVMGDSGLTCNQGGASGSTGIQRGGIALRNAAAEARSVLIQRAAEKLGVPADRLQTADGAVSVIGEPGKHATYTELVGAKYFNHKIEWNGKYGNDLVATGKTKPKSPDQYKVVGKSIPRRDIAGKVFGTDDFVTDVKVPGMLHGRMIRPPVAGATPLSVDEASVRDIPGVRVVRKNDFIGLVAEKEWDAIRAAEALKVQWSNAKSSFVDHDSVYDHIRRTPAAKKAVEQENGAVDGVWATAARVVEAEYEWPFQSHASMGPACALVDARADGATCWTGSQKPHFVHEGVAKILNLPPDKVRAIWVQGPGSYGRNDAGDAAMDAAVLSQAVGRPVRVQYMRSEGHGWDPKGPASIHRARAALDAQGNIIAYEFTSKGFSRWEVATNESKPNHTLAGMLLGYPDGSVQMFAVPNESYAFPNKRLGWETVPAMLAKASPLRGAHLRDPLGPQIHFASESFMDELASAIGADPVELRLRYLKDSRDIAVVKAAAERAGWKAGPPGARRGQRGDIATGRGIGYAQRNGTTVATIADVEVNRKTGAIWCRHFVVAHDCGIVVNPEGLRLCVEGNVVQGISRALWEEVTFDRNNVTSIDWLTYPILDMTEAPESVEVVVINRPEMPPQGAGEPSIRTIAAAIANAIFDATGVRLRRAPFTPDRVKTALQA
jgi:CO/xanthine dehydrogenase Mo-binding subunit